MSFSLNASKKHRGMQNQENPRYASDAVRYDSVRTSLQTAVASLQVAIEQARVVVEANTDTIALDQKISDSIEDGAEAIDKATAALGWSFFDDDEEFPPFDSSYPGGPSIPKPSFNGSKPRYPPGVAAIRTSVPPGRDQPGWAPSSSAMDM